MFSALPLPKLPADWRRAAGFVCALAIVCALSMPELSAAPRLKARGAKADKTAAAAKATKPARSAKSGAYNPQDETVELFEAMDAGQIQVKIIPKNSKEARIFIKNMGKKALNVHLPKAFGAVPILAQAGGQGIGGGGGGGMGGGGMFNIPADKEGDFKVVCVCLEHGKPEPRPQMTYSMKPIESVTTKPGVAEMLTELGEGRIPQRAAQVAAWHLNNGMSWEELAAKRIEHSDGRSFPYFTADELLLGGQISEQALRAAERAKQKEPAQPSTAATAASR